MSPTLILLPPIDVHALPLLLCQAAQHTHKSPLFYLVAHALSTAIITSSELTWSPIWIRRWQWDSGKNTHDSGGDALFPPPPTVQSLAAVQDRSLSLHCQLIPISCPKQPALWMGQH